MFLKFNILLLFILSANGLFADTLDIEPPVIKLINEECGYFEFTVSDQSTYQIDSLNYHFDSGINSKPFMTDIINFPDTVKIFNFDTKNPNKEFTISLQAINKYDTASAIIYAADLYDKRTGKRNIGSTRVLYLPKALAFYSAAVNFGVSNIDGAYSSSINIGSKYLDGLNIHNLKLSVGSHYRIVNKPPNPYFIKKDSTFQIEIEYKPIYDNFSAGNFDYDTLNFETDCLKYSVPISGQGAIPKIEVTDFYYGSVNIGNERCALEISENSNKYGITIKNIGTGWLVINKIYLKNGVHYKLKNINLPSGFDIEIGPGGSYELRDICFEPKVAGELIDTLVVASNASYIDSIAVLRGIGVEEGLYFKALDFGNVRVGDSKLKYIEIKNSSDIPIAIKDILLDASPDFSIIYDNIVPNLSSSILLYPENSPPPEVIKSILVPVVFQPQSEFTKMVKITPIFNDTAQFDNKVIFNYIQGFGFLPKFSSSGYNFSGKTLVNTKHSDLGMIRLQNISSSAALQVQSIKSYTADLDAPEDYFFPDPLPQAFTINSGQFKDIYFEFFPKTSGYRKMIIVIEHDGYAGIDNLSVLDTIEVTGVAYNKVISTLQYDFRSVLNCTTDTGYVKIFNISDTTKATIIRTEFVSGDKEAFRFLDNFYDEKITLKPGNDYNLMVEFNPSAVNTKTLYEAFAKIYTDVDTSVAIVSGRTYKLSAELDISDISGLAPGQLTKRELPDFPYKPINISLSSGVDFDSLNINEMKLEVAYNTKQLNFKNDFIRGDILKDWESVIVYSKHINADSALLIAEIYDSQKSLHTGGVLLNPVFEILLGDTNDINLKFINAEFGNSENCISEILLDGSIELSYCGDQMSKIYFSFNNYGLNSITPNPVSSDNFTVNYSVALDGFTDISLYNNSGIEVHNIISAFVEEGIYEINVKADELSSGVYFIKMQSGPFVSVTPLLIVK